MKKTTEKTKGPYIGQCRFDHNTLEQWDGKKWRPVQHVIHPEDGPSADDLIDRR